VTRPEERLAHGITREVLEADSVRAALQAHHPDVALRSDRDLLESVRATRAAAPASAAASAGVWLFAYGSLLWNPCVYVHTRRSARLYGFHRDFRLQLTHGRGSPECPGLMLGLVPGGSCRGAALQITGPDLEHELHLIWRRELITGVYQPRWVRLATDDGELDAVTFVIDPQHPCHAGRLDDATTVERLATGKGMIGTCAAYLESTVAHLDEVGLYDRRLHHLRARVRARLHERCA
jgi:cation transport protein ChaC